MVPGADPTQTLIHRAMGRFVSDVFVNGAWVIKDKKCTTIDVEALYREVRDFVQKERPEKSRRHTAKAAGQQPSGKKVFFSWGLLLQIGISL